MKTSVTDPWSSGTDGANDGLNDARFEDSFVSENADHSRLSDSEQYLARLYARLKHVKGGTSKKDLVNSLSETKADCVARLLTNGQRFETEEEALLATNPLVRHIAPHLQALTVSELVHLLKADVLQRVTDEQNGHQDDPKGETESVAEVPSKNGQSSEREESSKTREKLDNANIDAHGTIRIDDNTNVEQ